MEKYFEQILNNLKSAENSYKKSNEKTEQILKQTNEINKTNKQITDVQKSIQVRLDGEIKLTDAINEAIGECWMSLHDRYGLEIFPLFKEA